MTPPSIEQVRASVAYLSQTNRQRFAEAGDSFDRFDELTSQAQAILLDHAEESVACADRLGREIRRIARRSQERAQ